MQKLSLYELHQEAKQKHRYRIREGSIIWYGKAIVVGLTLFWSLVAWILLFWIIGGN